MKSTGREPDLFEACLNLITKSRRVRRELDEAWGNHMAARSMTTGYCLSLLDEAMARLADRERDQVSERIE